MHCVPPEQAGRIATFHVDEAVDFSQLQPVELGPGAGAPQIMRLAQVPCQFQPGAPGPQVPVVPVVPAARAVLPPAKWHKDEDGTEVPTIRAKKIYILD
jgi:hypothetical protein